MASSTSEATQAQAYVRIAAVSIFTYDYIRTLPAEWRFFKNQSDLGRITFAFILFLLVRYIGLIAVLLPTLMFFGTWWEKSGCTIIVYFTVYLRCISTTLASIVLARRTWAICHKAKTLGWVLSALTVVVAALEFWSQSYHTVSLHGGGCSGNNPKPKIAIIFYAANLAYDLVLAICATVQLWKSMATAGQWPPFSAFLFKEGIVYLLVVSAFNLLNCVFWSLPSSSGLQSLGATLGVAINAIMAQSVILSLQEALPRVGATNATTGDSQRSRQMQTGSRPGAYRQNTHDKLAYDGARSPHFDTSMEMNGVTTPPRYASPVRDHFHPASPQPFGSVRVDHHVVTLNEGEPVADPYYSPRMQGRRVPQDKSTLDMTSSAEDFSEKRWNAR